MPNEKNDAPDANGKLKLNDYERQLVERFQSINML
jgi:hypothetical protein